MRSALAAFPKTPWKREVLALSLRASPLQNGARRNYSQVASYMIKYSEWGNPQKVLYEHTHPVKCHPVSSDSVLVKMLLATVNIADLEMAAGSHCVQPALPAVAGNEGVGRIVEVGSNVKTLRLGDWVIPRDYGFGTWRSLILTDEKSLIRVPNDIPVLGAATLMMYPCTAYRILKCIRNLKPGDTIFQNSVFSPVGQAIIQLCKAWGIISVNILRDGPATKTLEHELKLLGADHVVTDRFLRTGDMDYFVKKLPVKPRLAVNCLSWGVATRQFSRYLADDAVMVTYGDMTRRPSPDAVTLCNREIHKVHGYWESSWEHEHQKCKKKKLPDMQEMVSELAYMMQTGMLQLPICDLYTLDMYPFAVKAAREVIDPRRIAFKIDDEVKL